MGGECRFRLGCVKSKKVFFLIFLSEILLFWILIRLSLSLSTFHNLSNQCV